MRVELSARAELNLAHMEATYSLPADTRERVRGSLEYVGLFPQIGRALEGEWQPLRMWVGPFRWMLFVYSFQLSATGCRYAQQTTWAHNDTRVNPGPARCVEGPPARPYG